MAEDPRWLYEAGIGENRAILVAEEDEWAAMAPGHGYAMRGIAYPLIIEAAIELPGRMRVGAVLPARLTAIHIPGRRGLVETEAGEALIEPLPAHLTEGQALRVEITREAIPERGRPKPARCRLSEAPERNGPSLAERIGPHRPIRPGESDAFERAGWSELIEQAWSGEIAFAGGALRMDVTPAMTLFDVDGSLPPADLAKAGAAAAARAIRQFGIGGSIGIDLPTLGAKPERLAAAEAVDALLPQPFERTAVNGFGFLQIVRRRERPSIPEMLQADPAGAAARALLRKAERTSGAGEREIAAAPAVIARIAERGDWIAELERRIGAGVRLREDPALALFAGHAQARHS